MKKDDGKGTDGDETGDVAANKAQAAGDTTKGDTNAPPATPKETPVSYTYIGPPAGAKGQALNYPGYATIVPSRLTPVQIAALEKNNPELFNRLWKRQ